MNDMTYKIYTENKRLRKIRRILNRLFNGYTLNFGEGGWGGKSEMSLTITICLSGQEGYLETRVKQAAQEIKELNNQESVLIEKSNVILMEA